MGNVPSNIPLYFKTEVGFEGPGSPEVTITIFECSNPILNYLASLLTSKVVVISNSARWSEINSDYPVYKRTDNSYLIFEVTFRTNKAEYFQLNYAQVGTDPISLGGRGGRPKSKHTYMPIKSREEL